MENASAGREPHYHEVHRITNPHSINESSGKPVDYASNPKPRVSNAPGSSRLVASNRGDARFLSPSGPRHIETTGSMQLVTTHTYESLPDRKSNLEAFSDRGNKTDEESIVLWPSISLTHNPRPRPPCHASTRKFNERRLLEDAAAVGRQTQGRSFVFSCCSKRKLLFLLIGGVRSAGWDWIGLDWFGLVCIKIERLGFPSKPSSVALPGDQEVVPWPYPKSINDNDNDDGNSDDGKSSLDLERASPGDKRQSPLLESFRIMADSKGKGPAPPPPVPMEDLVETSLKGLAVEEKTWSLEDDGPIGYGPIDPAESALLLLPSYDRKGIRDIAYGRSSKHGRARTETTDSRSGGGTRRGTLVIIGSEVFRKYKDSGAYKKNRELVSRGDLTMSAKVELNDGSSASTAAKDLSTTTVDSEMQI
ncbi:hypothetical protein MBM_01859 [Drepanopeziza brunnea f. sp. 'multigermtubi' MB_m1]|uniref:Uncharacterized protein n=1 Tax=Marssonina brunnea f. sp. multigermtubi (strain MB_m1) TaxID=1072389 RepID=K1X4C1_MARBU|nr:uncharacterized protein MBM_01859 [Drepanopeziza brunnea f. sp. 'multigermtubi' MB_m1]EKD19907.1 hypothetical protein MBM_01859 [Drepanopeziza brunnea f. sp. 'multigermtubi' MB_m1]